MSGPDRHWLGVSRRGRDALEGSSVLITGGTGSLGQALVHEILKDPTVRRVVVFSRDELKQSVMAQLPFVVSDERQRLRFFLGDIRDRDRLRRALEGIDVVVHCAALKQVPAGEYNPTEFMKTNVLGSQNVIEASLDTGVGRVVSLSTDKASSPINLYGATKLMSDKLMVAANQIKGNRDLRLSVVRYGNVMGSRGSVVPLFLDRARWGVLPITHPDMTRFHLSLDEGVGLVLWAIKHARGGEIFVPKIPSFRITDLAVAIAPSARSEIIGVRPGEKIHEEMIAEGDGLATVDVGPYYAILPHGEGKTLVRYDDGPPAKPVETGFRFSSERNDRFLTVNQLRELIRETVDPNFEPT